MARPFQLLRRAWRLRHDRDALLDGLNRAGVQRVPGARRYDIRSPRVGSLVREAWAGHVTRSLAELETLASLDGRESRDATLALADWSITHGDPDGALRRLSAVRRFPRDGRILFDEATRLTGPAPLHPLAEVNGRLRRGGFHHVSSETGAWAGLSSDSSPPIDGPLVTVIVTAVGSEHTISPTIASLCRQTWRNLEIIVVDDGDIDSSASAVATIDNPRLVLLRHETNHGPNAARSRALWAATGDFVTLVEADEWVHPARIATQVQHLMSRPAVIANTTAAVHVTDDLRHLRYGTSHGHFVAKHSPSLMMRTSTLRNLGGWDEVVVGADSELEARLIHVFGAAGVTHLHDTAPLTIARRDVASSLGDSSTGQVALQTSTGARRLYAQAYSAWHRSLSPESPGLHRKSDTDPFPCPALLRQPLASTDHFDVIILSDLALPGGTTASNLAEIAANERASWRTGLVHNRNPRFRDDGVNPKFFAACSDLTRFVCAGETVSCDVLVVKYPPAALRIPDVFPNIDVRRELVIAANQTPFTGYSGNPQLVYDIEQVNDEISRRFGRTPLWFPIGPAIRHVFETHHRRELATVRWADDDWFEIIDVAEWRRAERPDNGHVFRVGRHGRDSAWKWPSDPAALRSAYPSSNEFVIDILGGAEYARNVLGRLPDNWHVRPFDSISPRDFLAGLDVFVHVAHPDMEEGFGRTILEALATGVPVITESRFAGPFGDAVMSCQPQDVRRYLDHLRVDRELYDEMVRKGLELAESNFGFAAHHRRVTRLTG